MKKISIGTAVAGGLLCALALAGCQAGSGSTSGAAVAVTSSAATGGTGTSTGNPGDGVPSATPTGTAAVDAELNTVDQQLGTASTDLTQATATPSDGG